MTKPLPLLVCAACVSLLLLGGCAEGPVKADPAVVAELRSRYLLGEEPAGAVTPVGWREEQDESADEAEIADREAVLVGRIGGMPNPFTETEAAYPWRENEATFFLVDPATAAEFAEHAEEQGDDHAADCPFCAREAANKTSSIVAVTFVSSDGKPTPIDARELLGVAEGDTVVVRGKLSLVLPGDLLVMKASGLYTRE